MIQNSLSDDDLIALIDRKRRWQRIILLTMVALEIPLGGWAGWIIGQGRPIEMSEAILLATLFVVLIVSAVLVVLRLRPPKEAYEERILVKRTDKMQRGRTRALLLFPVSALLFTPGLVSATFTIMDRPMRPIAWFYLTMLGSVSVITVGYLMMLTGHGVAKRVRAIYDDELSRAYRAKAVQTGFWAMLGGGAALYLLGLYRPIWAVAGLPAVLMDAIAVSALQFALLERRADRDD